MAGLRFENSTALYELYTFCAACSVPEIRQLAETMSNRQEPMILAIQTGLSNARSEGFNRIVKTRRRHRFRLQTPENKRSQVRSACTPPIVASAIQHQAAAPLLTRVSRFLGAA